MDKEEKELQEFIDKVDKYNNNSAQDDYTELMEDFDREKAELSVAYHVYHQDIDLVKYETIVAMSNEELLQALADEISETDGSDIFGHEEGDDTWSVDD